MTVKFSRLANTLQSKFTSYYLLGIESHQFKFIYSSLNFKSFMWGFACNGFSFSTDLYSAMKWEEVCIITGFQQNHALSIKLHWTLLLINAASILSREKHPGKKKLIQRFWPFLEVSAEFLYVCTCHQDPLPSPLTWRKLINSISSTFIPPFVWSAEDEIGGAWATWKATSREMP